MAQQEQDPALVTSQAQVSRRILRATGALMAIQIFIRAFGLIEKMVMSKYLGTGGEASAYSAARRIAQPVMQLGEQVIMHSFLPSFVLRMRNEGEKDAWRFASTTINLMVVLMGVIAIIGLLFTPQVLSIFLSGWETRHPELIELAIGLTRVVLVAMIFLAIASITYCLLNSYKQFALPASADLALKASTLLFAILLARSWGAYAFAGGFMVGAIAKLTVQATGLGKHLSNYRPVVDLKHPGLKHFLWLALPLIVGWACSSFRGWMETKFISNIANPASMPALDYAKTLTDVPVIFFPYAFGIALFPFLTDIAMSGDRERQRGMLMTASRMMLLIFIPLAITYIVLRYPIINGLYGSKIFNAASTEITVGPLWVYAIAMLAGALEIIVNQFFFAMQDTLRPTLIGMAMLPVYFLVAYLGVFNMEWGAVAIALAFLVYRSSKVTVLYILIRRKLGMLEGKETLLLLGKIALALLPFIGILWLLMHFLPSSLHVARKVAHILHKEQTDKIVRFVSLLPYAGVAILGFIPYGGVLLGLRVKEMTTIMVNIRRKLRRK